MINLAAMHRVRKRPVFTEYLDAVLPIFWPVVFWYLLRVCDQMDARRCNEILVMVHSWGGIGITYYGDPAPAPPTTDHSPQCAKPGTIRLGFHRFRLSSALMGHAPLPSPAIAGASREKRLHCKRPEKE